MIKKSVSVLLAALMLFGLIPVGVLQASAAKTDSKAVADTPPDCPALAANTANQATLSVSPAAFSFNPDETGEYVFYSTGELDTVADLYDSQNDYIVGDDDSGANNNFRLTASLTANQTYYLNVRLYSGDPGEVELYVEAVPHAESLSIDKGDSYTSYVGSVVEMNAVFSPADSVYEAVEWTTSDSTVAAVSADDERATVSLLKAGTATVTATSASGLTAQITFIVLDAAVLTVNQPANAEITQPEDFVLFRFIPAETGTYSFFSAGSCDTMGYLLNSDMETIDSDDDSGGDSQFRMTGTLTGGTTYYLKVRCYSTQVGSFSVTVQKNTAATGVEFVEGSAIESYPTNEIGLHARFLPEGAVEQELDWESSDASVVSLTGTSYSNTIRYFRLNKPGTATVTASAGSGLTASMTVTVKDFETLSAGETKTTVIGNSGEKFTYKITPSKSGYYAFWSQGSGDTIATLFDSQMTELTYDDDGGESSNFRITRELEAGETYYLQTRFYNSATGSFPVAMAEIPRVTGLEILTPPTRTIYYEGAVDNYYFDLSGMSLRINWSDGVEMVWNSGDDSTVRGESIITELDDTTVTVRCGEGSDQFEIEIRENPVESIAFTGGAIELIENAGGTWEIGNDGESFFRYDLSAVEAPEITVYYKDGTTAVTHLGAELNGFRVTYLDRQRTEHFTLGNQNQILASYLGCQATATVTVLAGSVAGIEVVSTYDEHLVENFSGYWTTRRNPQTGANEEFFFYDLFYLSDIKVRINYLDGTSVEADYGDVVDGYRIEGRTNQYEEPWTVGGENPLVISYMGRETVLNIDIEPNPVASLVLLTPSQNTLIENADGYLSQRYDNVSGSYVDYFCYSLYRLYDAVVQINFKNGESVTAHPGDYVNGYYVNTESNQAATPFTVGDNPYFISYLGAKTAAVATVAESPVQNIEVLGGYRVSFYENVDGYWTEQYSESEGGIVRFFVYRLPSLRDMDIRVTYKNGSAEIVHPGTEANGYDVETRQDQYGTPWVMDADNSFRVCYLGVETDVPVDILANPVSGISVIKNTETTLIENGDGYYNSYGSQHFIYEPGNLSDAEILISYADGTTATAHIGDRIDGYRVSYTGDQYGTPWTVGSNNFVTVSYMGRDAQMPVTVVPTPLESLTIDQAPLRQYVYGDEYYGGSDYFSPDDFAGLRFTVTFKDGTTKTYTQDDIEDGRMIDGHIFFIQNESTQTVGEMPVTFNYMGKTAVYNVKVRESGISTIEVIRLPSKPVYSQYYSPDFRGMRIAITYTNGTSKNVTMSESSIIYGFNGNIGYYTGFVYGNVTGMIRSTYRNGERIFYVSYAGLECEITGLTYREDRTVTAVDIEDFSMSAENMLVTATNSDGSTESFRLTDIKDNRIGWVPEAYYVRALTANGMLEFYIANPDYAEYMDFDVRIFDISVKLDGSQAANYIRGDVNGDGIVTIDDATKLQSYLAEFPVTNITLLKKCADANADGNITVKDVTAIQRYLADLENLTRIGEEIAA